MAQAPPSREIEFEAVFSFRDLGGYLTSNGRQVTRGRVFRSAGLHDATAADALRLRQELALRSVLDLRNRSEVDRQKSGPANDGFGYFNVSLSVEDADFGDTESLNALSNTGQVYLQMIRTQGYGRRLVECLNVIAEPDNHPLVFHCAAGKDRTGVLAACLLSVLGVGDQDIIEDYTRSARYMPKIIERASRDPESAKFLQSLPPYMHEAPAISMELFLSTMKQDYGSIHEYLMSSGAEPSLFERLEKALLA